MKNTQKRFDKCNYLLLSKWVSALTLFFSSHEILNNKIIGLDGIKRKLLVAEKNNESGSPYIIELAKVTAITLKKIYKSIKAGALKTRRMEEFLESILLQFEYATEEDPVV